VSWTAPRTWVTDEIVTSSLLNTHVRDNLLSVAHPYDYAPADVDVTNTTTETSLWSKVITGGDMGANGTLRLNLYVDVLHNNAAGDTVTLRVKFGGSTQITQSFTWASTSATRFILHLPFLIANKGATNSQLIVAEQLPSYGSGSDYRGTSEAYTTASVDTTADQTFQITAQWSAASANNSFRKRLAVLHLGQN
jgi:hypothetical protein